MYRTRQFQGIIPPLVTPFDEGGKIDLELLRAEVRYHLAQGIDGLCVTGSTGDGQMLSIEQSVSIAAATVEEVDGKVPVIAGIIKDSTTDVINYGLALRATGVDALQVTPVHYLFQPDQEGTLNYYRAIASAVSLPVVVYNVIPYALIPAETVCRLLDEIPLVVAVKQSGGNIHQLADLLHARPNSGEILTAVDDLLLPAYLLGAAGAISATLTVAPALCVEQWRAAKEGNFSYALEIHNKLLPIWRSIDGPNMTARIKTALRLQGRDGGLAGEPLAAVTPHEEDAIRAALFTAGLVASADRSDALSK